MKNSRFNFPTFSTHQAQSFFHLLPPLQHTISTLFEVQPSTCLLAFPMKHSRFNENSSLNFHNNRLAEKCVVSFIHFYLRVERKNATRNFFFIFFKHQTNRECFSLSIEIAVWRWLFGWRWFLKVLIKFILHVCAPHISSLSYFIFLSWHKEEKILVFSGIFNKEWGKFMLRKIIKNNYRNEKNMFLQRPNTSWQY